MPVGWRWAFKLEDIFVDMGSHDTLVQAGIILYELWSSSTMDQNMLQ